MFSAAASRYARALADVIGPAGDYRAMLRELEDFAAVYRESRELREAFDSPTVTAAQKRNILDAVLKRMGASPLASNFFRVLQAHYRMPLLEAVIGAFRRIANRRMGIVEVRVDSARPLTAEEQDALRERFAKLTGRTVEIEFHRDEKLLGGVKAQIESTVYDGSVLGYLERIGRQLKTQ